MAEPGNATQQHRELGFRLRGSGSCARWREQAGQGRAEQRSGRPLPQLTLRRGPDLEAIHRLLRQPRKRGTHRTQKQEREGGAAMLIIGVFAIVGQFLVKARAREQLRRGLGRGAGTGERGKQGGKGCAVTLSAPLHRLSAAQARQRTHARPRSFVRLFPLLAQRWR